MTSTAENKTQPAPAKSRKLLIALAVVAAGATGAGAAFYLTPGALSAAQARPAPEASKPIFVAVEPLTVNLIEGQGRKRFLHVGVSLRVRDEQSQQRLQEAMPELRSRLLLLLSDRNPDELMTVADKTRLADQIKTEMDRPIAAGAAAHGVVSVGFTAFVVQ